MSEPLKPAEMLEGMILDETWKVRSRLSRCGEATGGNFSCGYVIESTDGRIAYLKALDFFSSLATSADPARELEPMVRAFNHERDLLARCRDRRLSNVVTAMFDGKVDVNGPLGQVTVQYIAFELATADIREQMSKLTDLDLAWALRSLHQIAVGLSQLHGIGIAHQDTKPSNVLCFEDGERSKIADLGRAVAKGVSGPFDEMLVAGDLSYAPPELLYGADIISWEDHRLGCDIYHLGSMVVFIFALQGMTPLLLSQLKDELHWRTWSGRYADILPFLRAAFAEAVNVFALEVPSECREDLIRMIQELCDPDPRLRGHPRQRHRGAAQFSLQRYVTQLDLLARRAEYRLTRAH